mgnify:CR=1 FL=1
MIKIAICDDEKNYRDKISEFCKHYSEEHHLEIEITEYVSGEDLLASEKLVDILLLDVQMNNIDGLSVKDILGRQKRETKIIFISSHEEVMAEAFGWQVYGFLHKPVDYGLFCKKLDAVTESLCEDNKYIILETSDMIKKILLKDIEYIHSDGRYSEIYVVGEEGYLFSDKSIGAYKTELGEDFGLSHRSYLVNYKYIESIDKDIVLTTHKHLPLSRRIEKEFKKEYKSYIWRQTV